MPPEASRATPPRKSPPGSSAGCHGAHRWRTSSSPIDSTSSWAPWRTPPRAPRPTPTACWPSGPRHASAPGTKCSLVLRLPVARDTAPSPMSGRAWTTSSAWASTSSTCRPSIPSVRPARKGRNAVTTAAPDDPGSPWAIGGAEGGHTALHPELGGIDDFRALVGDATARGIDVAIDLAFQASPDHPWVREHPSWFRHRPDGTHPVRREPAQAVRGHLPLRLRVAGLARPLGRAPRRRPLLDRPGRHRVQGRQPPHQAVPVLGVAHRLRSGPRPPTPSSCPRRSPGRRSWSASPGSGSRQSYTYFTWRTSKWELETYLNELTEPGAGRLLPAQPLAQHARHPLGGAAVRWPRRVPVPTRPGRNPVRRATEYTGRRSSSRSTCPESRLGGVPPARRSTRSARGISTARPASRGSSRS